MPVPFRGIPGKKSGGAGYDRIHRSGPAPRSHRACSGVFPLRSPSGNPATGLLPRQSWKHPHLYIPGKPDESSFLRSIFRPALPGNGPVRSWPYRRFPVSFPDDCTRGPGLRRTGFHHPGGWKKAAYPACPAWAATAEPLPGDNLFRKPLRKTYAAGCRTDGSPRYRRSPAVQPHPHKSRFPASGSAGSSLPCQTP